MIEIYADEFLSMMRKRLYTSFIGIPLALGLEILGVVIKSDLLMIGGPVVIVVAMAHALFHAKALSRSTYCPGDVFEVSGDTVCCYHKTPFFYDKKSVGGSRLIPVRPQLLASITMHFPVDGKIISYTLLCEAVINDTQRFYDAFLKVREKESPQPHSVMAACIATFLQQSRPRIIELYGRGGVGVYVFEETWADASHYLGGEFARYGIIPYHVVPQCEVSFLLIK